MVFRTFRRQTERRERQTTWPEKQLIIGEEGGRRKGKERREWGGYLWTMRGSVGGTPNEGIFVIKDIILGQLALGLGWMWHHNGFGGVALAFLKESWGVT